LTPLKDCMAYTHADGFEVWSQDKYDLIKKEKKRKKKVSSR